MSGRSSCPADQQRQLKSLPLHFLRDIHHLVEGRCNESRQPDVVGILAPRGIEDLVAGDHDSEIDHLEVIALEHYTDDVLADVVYVALYGRNYDSTVRARHAALPLLDERHQVGHRALHHTRTLDDLRQEHLAGSKQVADDVHSIHQRAFDDLQRTLEGQAGLFRVLDDEVVYSLDQRVLETLRDRQVTPLRIRLLSGSNFTLVSARQLQQALGGIRPPVQNHILHHIAQLGIDICVDGKLSGIHDSHVHAS